MTKDGQAVASSNYNLYGASKASTDTTGNPFAYNGEARDDTGLDYLRARYYDSQGGTFLTEDSYPGEATDPLSQNRYSYVQNNSVNYTDPSGHRMIWAVDGSEPSRPRRINTRLQRIYQQSIVGQDILGRPLTLREYTDHRIKTDRTFRAPDSYYQAFGPNVATYQGGSYGGQSSYAYAQQQAARTRAQAEQRRRQQIRYEYGLATGLQSLPIIREGLNLYRNWNTSLLNTLKHVCNPKTTKASDRGVNKTLSIADFRKYEDAARHGLRLNQKERIDRMTLEEYLKAPPMTPEENAYASNVKFAKFNQENKAKLPTLTAEFIGWNNGERLVTGKDPLTGEDANRLAAGAELAVDIASNFFPIAKAGKLRKLEKALDAVDAVNDASKATKVVDKANDAARVVDKVDDVKDGTKALTSQEIADKFVSGMEDISRSGTKNFQSYGGYEKALEDFNSLPLENIKEINTSFGKGYVGTLSDGTDVVVRRGSTSERGATLEFQIRQSKGGVSYEIRYGD